MMGKNKVKENKFLKKENIPIYLAILILICLVIALIYVLFFTKSNDVIVPDLPDYDNYDVGVIDFSDKNANANDLNNKKTSNMDITNTIVSDYYKEGIMLSNTQVEYLNDNFVITSGPSSSSESFISVIDKNGKLKWLTKLDDKEYGSIKVAKTVSYDNKYYVAAISEKNSKKSLVLIQVDLNGKRVNTNVIKSDFDYRIQDLKVSSDFISIVTSSVDTVIYFVDTQSNEYKKDVAISKFITAEGYMDYCASQINNTSLSVVINNSSKYYVVNINASNYLAQVTELTDINNINSDNSLYIGSYLNGFVAYSAQKVYKLNNINKLINKFDYASIKLEDDTAYKKKYKDDESIDVSELVNTIAISNVSVNQEKIIVGSNTAYSIIYDVYDENLKLNKRFIIDAIDYQYEDGVLLNNFYIDGAIYEVYSYGFETPSILISKMG